MLWLLAIVAALVFFINPGCEPQRQALVGGSKTLVPPANPASPAGPASKEPVTFMLVADNNGAFVVAPNEGTQFQQVRVVTNNPDANGLWYTTVTVPGGVGRVMVTGIEGTMIVNPNPNAPSYALCRLPAADCQVRSKGPLT